MSEERTVIFKTIRRDTPLETIFLPKDIRTNYSEMVAGIRENPQSIIQHRHVIEEILAPYAEDKGELSIDGDGNKICFLVNGKKFTDFGVVVLAVVKVHSIDSEEYHLEMLILGQDIPPKIIMVNSLELGSNRWIEKLGPSYIYEKQGIGRLQTLVKAMAKFAPVRNEYQFSGWEVDGGKAYVMDGRPLCARYWDAVKAKQTCEHVLGMLDVATHSLTIPLLSVELLSLVHSRMVAGGTYFKGVCCVVAPTQSFKTTLAALFLNLNNGLEADLNFEATTAAIVRTIGSVRDSTVILDDYKPGATKAESNDMTLKLSKAIQMCSDDSGGVKRAGAQNSTISNVANCLTVVTAEQIQLNVQSTLARLLILEGDRQSVDKGKLTYLQASHSKYREFIKQYILYISKQGVDEYCKNLAQKFLQNRDTLRKKMSDKDVLVDNRTSDMGTWLYISFGKFLEYALDVGAINQEQSEKYSQEALQIFLSLMEQQAERVSELDDVKRFFKGLQILIETKEAKIEQLQARNNNFITSDSRQAIGFSKKGFIYLKNGIAFQQVAAYYRRFGKEFAVSEAALRKSFRDNRYILPKDEKIYIHRLFVNHETYQCIKFEDKKFFELLNGCKQDGSEGDREVPDNRGLYKNADNFLGR